MNQAPISPNLNRSWEESQQIIKNLEAEITQLKAQQEVKSCQCHTIDANKVSVLMWAEKNSTQKGSIQTKCSCSCHAQNFILKIAQQKLRGLIRTDKYKVTYWKFRNLVEEIQAESNSTPNPTPTELSPQLKEKLAQHKAKYAQIREKEMKEKEQTEKENNPVQKVESTQEPVKETNVNQ